MDRQTPTQHDTSHASPTSAELALVARTCKGLAHPARVHILQHLLAVDGCVCGRIVEVVGLAQSTVSQHLKVLKEAGLIRGEVEGPRTCYCVDRDALAGLGRSLLEMLEIPEEQP